MSSFNIEVRTQVRNEHWRYLSELAQKHHTTIGALVAEIVRRQLANVPLSPEPTAGSIYGRRVTDEDRDRIKELHAQGNSFLEISRNTGLSPRTVTLHAERMGLQKQPGSGGRPKKTDAA